MPGALSGSFSHANAQSVVDFESDLEDLASPLIEQDDPFQGDQSMGYGIDGESAQYLNVRSIKQSRRHFRRSVSDQILGTQTGNGNSSPDYIQPKTPIEGNIHNGLSGRPLRPLRRNSLRRSSSTPVVEVIRSRFHDPTIDSATLQHQLVMQTKHTGQRPVKPWRVRRARTTQGPFQWSTPQSKGPGFMWFPVDSKSESESFRTMQPKSKHAGTDLPLKTCLKPKSKSAATTPPSGSHQSDTGGVRKLRRVKTVDFEEDISRKLLSLPPLKVWTDEPKDLANKANKPTTRGQTKQARPPKTTKHQPSCPGPKTKSGIADPAVTRTDVHVVAIAPSWMPGDTPNEDAIDPVTPTMQIVESKNGCYEVIWDDVQPEEDDIGPGRRGSTASQALHKANSSPVRGLERVNSKLTDWAWGGEDSPKPFIPQIVVFPDDDGRTSRFDCAVEDDEDCMVLAPPNSQRTSANASRRPSRPGSARHSRSCSTDDAEPLSYASTRGSTPDSGIFAESQPDTIDNKRGRARPTIRKLSNLEEIDLRFQGHRNSVTLARSRIFNDGGVSPELFMHRDSVSMAKKRMHERNHATSFARPIHKTRSLEDLSCSASPVDGLANATEALKYGTATSIFQPKPNAAPRHIRIVE
ncbi:hypothetical protein BDV95DRAFT_612167 [Massariosphaeria phaeospora]|uniref:Uncharacterized protein n=1 Tax=Massariosphaeria phaeospora TaxID=100035 RepID=A0A7C8MCG6_9PLEO|nr:hypothetical protein BDV95DRAFT_612167 [Massariosphaeria phaeospora]